MRQTINEEITKAEIRSMIDSKVSEFLKEREFEMRVKELTANAVEKFFKMMYNKRTMWKSELKNA